VDPYEKDLSQSFTEPATPLIASGKFKPLPIKQLPGGLTGIGIGLDLLRGNQVSGRKLILSLEGGTASPRI